jgi:hypothetical protein
MSHRFVRNYTALFFIGFVTWSVFSAGSLIYFKAWPAGCDGSGYTDDFYMAWCASPNYQFFDHGAIFFSLDEASNSNLKSADILILGDSRTQTAFSAEAIDRYFMQQNLRYFSLGFGNGEADIFPMAIIKKFNLRPKYVLIDATYFFENHINGFSSEIVRGSVISQLEYYAKALFQPLHKWLCGSTQKTIKPYFCGSEPTIYRSRINGTWEFKNFSKTKNNIPIRVATSVPANTQNIQSQRTEIAKKYKKILSDLGACMIITFVPRSGISPRVTRDIAKAVNAPLAIPNLAGLATWDNSHLNDQSVKVFAERFVDIISAARQECP